MKLSDLGLPAEDVNRIMLDLNLTTPDGTTQERQPEPPKGVEGPGQLQPIVKANDVAPAIDNTKAQDVGTSLRPPKPGYTIPPKPGPRALPPAVIPPGMKPSTGKPGVAAYLAAAGAGFLVGGPIGAAVGAGAVALLGGKPAPKAVLPPVQQSATPTMAAAAAQPVPVKVAQVTPTSTAAQPAPAPVAQPAKAPVADRTISMTSRTAGAALASRLKLP